MIIALIPAHNEQGMIGAAIRGLKNQTQPPDQIIVMADNCTDDTVTVARAFGADVTMTTRGNVHKKAGAINQFLDGWGLRYTADDDVILIQDADTVLAPEFIEAAMAELDAETGAVGGVFYGETGGGLLGQLQRSEFCRYGRQISRDGGKVRVLSGTASMFMVSTLRNVEAARKDGRLGNRLWKEVPPASVGVYDVRALTEDN